MKSALLTFHRSGRSSETKISILMQASSSGLHEVFIFITVRITHLDYLTHGTFQKEIATKVIHMVNECSTGNVSFFKY